MNFQQSLTFLDSLFPRTFRLALEPLASACELFGNPQRTFPAVHIAGTNGKGSTAAFIHSILVKSGLRVGLYTSPHLISVRERIQLGGIAIAEERFASLTERIQARLPDDRLLTYFEFLTLMAFLAFQEARVDIAVVEVGLGGRLDATNLVSPAVTVLTPISLDHQEHLGTTLAEIAAEKCGIFKRGVPAITALQVPEAMAVVEQSARELGIPLQVASPQSITMPLGLAGEHQRQNAACAFEAIGVLSRQGFQLSQIDQGFAEASWPCRLEVVQQNPRVIVDGAHNPAGAATVAAYLRSHANPDKTELLVGMLADKDSRGIVEQFVPWARQIWCTTAPSPRGVNPHELAQQISACGGKARVVDEPEKALAQALSGLAADETLVIAGSLTLAGAAKEFFSQHQSPSPLPLSPMGERDKG